ncbi:hypothetical protein H4582DRAFT_2060691 [Lactarius indigo]|nr:hypothetical protein H4582DRAFT_2060691 [Lactarius indigo]
MASIRARCGGFEENTIPQMPSESTVDNLPSQSSSSRLTLAPPSASTGPPWNPRTPSHPPTRTQYTRHSKGTCHTDTFVGPPGRCSIQTPHCSICAAEERNAIHQEIQEKHPKRVEVEQASPPRPTQRQRTDAGDIVAYGNDRCGPCIHFGDAECKAQANKRSITCVKCAQRHKPCEPPATWAIPLHRAMEARSTPSMGAGSPASGTPSVDALERKVESLTSKLGDVTQTVDRVLFEVGIESTSIPGVGMPPTNRRSVSPGVQSTSSVGAHMSGLTLSDIRPPSSLSSAPPSHSRQPSGESVASGGRLTPSGISGGSSSAGPVA